MKILTISIATFLISVSVFPQQSWDSVFTIISNDTVRIWNTGVYENCACLFRMDVALSNDTIYVTEVDTATNWAFCLCYFDLCASISGLQSGNYFVEVYRKFLLDPDSVYYIGSTTFTYQGSVLAFISHSYQSECYNITEIKGHEEYPKEFTLEQNFPNPFNPTTIIRYQLTLSSYVTLKVFNVLGSEITTLENEYKRAGTFQINWDAVNLSSGVYFYQLKIGDLTATKKMVLLR